MNELLIGVIFLAAAILSLAQGIPKAFAYVYVPSLLFLSAVNPIPLTGIPDAQPHFAALYGICLGLLFDFSRLTRLRFHLIDAVVVLLVITATACGIANAEIYTGVSTFGNEFFRVLCPYFLARITIADPDGRRAVLKIAIVAAIVLGAFALVEARLWPYAYSKFLQMFGLGGSWAEGAYKRFGFFRAQTSFVHPIDLGNSAIGLAFLIAALALATARKLTEPLVMVGVVAALTASIAALSFGPFLALAFAAIILVAFHYAPFFRNWALLVPLALLLTGAAGIYNMALETRKPLLSMTDAERSYLVRVMIVQDTLSLPIQAFGYGDKFVKYEAKEVRTSRDTPRLEVESVDNTYMLHLIRRGPIYLAVYLLMPLAAALVVMLACSRARSPDEWMPIILAYTGTLALNVGMFTVWDGMPYFMVYLVLLGLTVSLADALRDGLAFATYVGFPVAPNPLHTPTQTAPSFPLQP